MINGIDLNQTYNMSTQGTTSKGAAVLPGSFSSMLSSCMDSAKSIGDVNAEPMTGGQGDGMLSDNVLSSDIFLNLLGDNAGTESITQLLYSILGLDASNAFSGMGNTSFSGYSSAAIQKIGSGATPGYSAPNYSEAIPSAASKAVNPFIRSNTATRNAGLYRKVINQFNVETNPRYAVNKKGRNDTYCNIFIWDVTSAMGAEIPHYVDPVTREPMYYPSTKGARELTANATYDWLATKGEKYGWKEVTAEQAQLLANQGKPVVTAKKNNSGKGHVQVVCPSADGKYDPQRGVTIAQAGSKLTNYATMASLYGTSSPQFKYYAHI